MDANVEPKFSLVALYSIADLIITVEKRSLVINWLLFCSTFADCSIKPRDSRKESFNSNPSITLNSLIKDLV